MWNGESVSAVPAQDDPVTTKHPFSSRHISQLQPGAQGLVPINVWINCFKIATPCWPASFLLFVFWATLSLLLWNVWLSNCSHAEGVAPVDTLHAAPIKPLCVAWGGGVDKLARIARAPACKPVGPVALIYLNNAHAPLFRLERGTRCSAQTFLFFSKHSCFSCGLIFSARLTKTGRCSGNPLLALGLLACCCPLSPDSTDCAVIIVQLSWTIELLFGLTHTFSVFIVIISYYISCICILSFFIVHNIVFCTLVILSVWFLSATGTSFFPLWDDRHSYS